LIPDDSQLKVLLPSCVRKPLEGIFYRALRLENLYGFHRPLEARYSPKALYVQGAFQRGARFTPLQSAGEGISSLYFAEAAQTAYDEVTRARDFSALMQNPAVIVALEVKLTALLDLTDPTVLSCLSIDAADLMQPWEIAQKHGITPTQRFGKCAFECGIHALRYPSFQSQGGFCYVVYTENLGKDEYIRVIDGDGNLNAVLPESD
jgi:RES domain-containing protein